MSLIVGREVTKMSKVVNKGVVDKSMVAPFIQVSTEFECLVRDRDKLYHSDVNDHNMNNDAHYDGIYEIPGFQNVEVSTRPVMGGFHELYSHFKKATDHLAGEYDARAGDSNHIHIVVNPYFVDWDRASRPTVAFKLPEKSIFTNMARLVLRNYAALRYLAGSWGRHVARQNSYSRIYPPGEGHRNVDALWNWRDDGINMPNYDRSTALRAVYVHQNVLHMEYRAADGNLSPAYLTTMASILKALTLRAIDLHNYDCGRSLERYREENIDCLREIAYEQYRLDRKKFEDRMNVLVDDIMPYAKLVGVPNLTDLVYKLFEKPAWEFRIEHPFDGQEWFQELDKYLLGRNRRHDEALYNSYIQALVSNAISRMDTLEAFEKELADHLNTEFSKVRSIRVRLGNDYVKWMNGRLVWLD